MPAPILRVRDLTVYFHAPDDLEFKRALDGLSLDIYPGEDFAVIGESGSGKSTFAKAILGQTPAIPGIIRGDIKFANREGEWHLVGGCDEVWREEDSTYAGRVIGERRSGALRRWRRELQDPLADLRGKRIALITQDTGGSLNPYVTVGRQIADCIQAGRRAHGKRVIEYMADAALGSMDHPDLLEEYARRYPSQLSGGQRQRVLIAMALASEPDLIIADEPTTGLDVLRKGEVIELFERLLAQKEHRRGKETTLLLITHDLETVRRIASRVAVLYRGRLMEMMPVTGRRLPCRHPYSQVLTGSYDDLEYSYQPPDEDRPVGVLMRGCRYRTECQLYARHLRKARKNDYDLALCAHCAEQEPPLFMLDRGTGQYLCRCWGKVPRERWSEYVPRGSEETEQIGV